MGDLDTRRFARESHKLAKGVTISIVQRSCLCPCLLNPVYVSLVGSGFDATGMFWKREIGGSKCDLLVFHVPSSIPCSIVLWRHLKIKRAMEQKTATCVTLNSIERLWLYSFGARF